VSDDWSEDLDEAIRRTAYFLWVQDGRPEGKAQYYWELAKEQHLRERAYDLWLAEGAPDGKDIEFWDKAQGGMP
jgi:hypothetical protein